MNKYKVIQTQWTIIRAENEDEARFKHQQLLIDDGEIWTDWEIQLIEGQCDGVEGLEEVEDDNRDGMMPCPDCEGEGEVEDDNR